MYQFVYLILLLSTFSVFGQEIEVSGTYQGKDLYVRNPYIRQSETFCVKNISVNGTSVMNAPEITALRVDLSRFARGEMVSVKITYTDGCRPLVLNPEVLKMDRDFKFKEFTVNNNSIDFTTQGEKRYGKFVIEKRYTRNDLTTFWEFQFEVEGKGKLTENRYSVEPKHDPDDNVYRVIYLPLEGEKIVSDLVTYTSTTKPITFFPFTVSDKIEFSRYTAYEISDMSGRVLKTGNGREVYVQDLKPGEYMIKIQNRYERFVKKAN